MYKWLGRLRNAIRPGRLDRDLERELRFHVTERIEELQNAGGISAEAAARLARQRFGNYTAQVERTRDMDIAEGMDAMLRNVRLALRVLAKSPAFSITPSGRRTSRATPKSAARCPSAATTSSRRWPRSLSLKSRRWPGG